MCPPLLIGRISAAAEVSVGTSEASVAADTALPYCSSWEIGFGSSARKACHNHMRTRASSHVKTQ